MMMRLGGGRKGKWLLNERTQGNLWSKIKSKSWTNLLDAAFSKGVISQSLTHIGSEAHFQESVYLIL